MCSYTRKSISQLFHSIHFQKNKVPLPEVGPREWPIVQSGRSLGVACLVAGVVGTGGFPVRGVARAVRVASLIWRANHRRQVTRSGVRCGQESVPRRRTWTAISSCPIVVGSRDSRRGGCCRGKSSCQRRKCRFRLQIVLAHQQVHRRHHIT